MNHTIQRIILDLELQEKSKVRPVNDTLSFIIRHQLTKEIEQLFESVNFRREEELYVFDTINLDIGPIEEADLESEFCAKVISALKEQLIIGIAKERLQEEKSNFSKSRATQALYNGQPKLGSTTANNALNQIIYFLKHGYLPYYASSSIKVNALFEKVLNKQTQTLAPVLSNVLITQPDSIKRLAQQISIKNLHKIYQLLIANYNDSFLALEKKMLKQAKVRNQTIYERRSILDYHILSFIAKAHQSGKQRLVYKEYKEYLEQQISANQVKEQELFNKQQNTASSEVESSEIGFWGQASPQNNGNPPQDNEYLLNWLKEVLIVGEKPWWSTEELLNLSTEKTLLDTLATTPTIIVRLFRELFTDRQLVAESQQIIPKILDQCSPTTLKLVTAKLEENVSPFIVLFNDFIKQFLIQTNKRTATNVEQTVWSICLAYYFNKQASLFNVTEYVKFFIARLSVVLVATKVSLLNQLLAFIGSLEKQGNNNFTSIQALMLQQLHELRTNTDLSLSKREIAPKLKMEQSKHGRLSADGQTSKYVDNKEADALNLNSAEEEKIEQAKQKAELLEKKKFKEAANSPENLKSPPNKIEKQELSADSSGNFIADEKQGEQNTTDLLRKIEKETGAKPDSLQLEEGINNINQEKETTSLNPNSQTENTSKEAANILEDLSAEENNLQNTATDLEATNAAETGLESAKATDLGNTNVAETDVESTTADLEDRDAAENNLENITATNLEDTNAAETDLESTTVIDLEDTNAAETDLKTATVTDFEEPKAAKNNVERATTNLKDKMIEENKMKIPASNAEDLTEKQNKLQSTGKMEEQTNSQNSDSFEISATEAKSGEELKVNSEVNKAKKTNTSNEEQKILRSKSLEENAQQEKNADAGKPSNWSSTEENPLRGDDANAALNESIQEVDPKEETGNIVPSIDKPDKQQIERAVNSREADKEVDRSTYTDLKEQQIEPKEKELAVDDTGNVTQQTSAVALEILVFAIERGFLSAQYGIKAPKELEGLLINLHKKHQQTLIRHIQKLSFAKLYRNAVLNQITTPFLSHLIKLLQPKQHALLVSYFTLLKSTSFQGLLPMPFLKKIMLDYARKEKLESHTTYHFSRFLIKMIVMQKGLSTKAIAGQLLKALNANNSSSQLLGDFKAIVSVIEKNASDKKPYRPTATNANRAVDSKEPIFVQNAGIVLLWPFFGLLFQRLELLDKSKKFKHPAAVNRGVHFMQYMVNKQSQTPETELTLNKILCGVRPSFPIVKQIQVSPEEDALTDSLINAVIQQWSALKNTTPAQLRGSFLLRDGKLMNTDGSGCYT